MWPCGVWTRLSSELWTTAPTRERFNRTYEHSRRVDWDKSCSCRWRRSSRRGIRRRWRRTANPSFPFASPVVRTLYSRAPCLALGFWAKCNFITHAAVRDVLACRQWLFCRKSAPITRFRILNRHARRSSRSRACNGRSNRVVNNVCTIMDY